LAAPTRLLHVHDSIIRPSKPFRASGCGLDQPLRGRHLLLARAEDAVGGLDLARVDQGLAVEAERPSLLALGAKPLLVLKPIVDSIECGDPCPAGGEDDGLEAVGQPSARRPARKAEIGRKVVRTRDQPPPCPLRWQQH
jgi:hypothetical protein